MAEKGELVNDGGLGAASGLVPPKNLEKMATNKGNPVASVTPTVDSNKVSPVDPKGAGTVPSVDPNKTTAQAVGPVVVDTPLGKQTYGGKPLTEIDLKSFADVQAFAKDFAGIELKDVKDFVPLFGQLKELQDKANKVDQLTKAVENYETTLNNLPEDVSLILTAALQGEDYLPVIQKIQQKVEFDFDKSFESHDSLDLINHYTGKSYTQESLDALTPDVQEALQSVAKVKYEADRKDYQNIRTNLKKSTDEKQGKFRASVESSISQMLTKNPGVGKDVIDRVRQIMTYGLSDVLFTKDKVYLPDAAEKVAYLEFGKQVVEAQARTIGDLVKRMTNEGASKATENLLLRSDKPVTGSGGTAGDKNLVAAAVARETGFLKAR